jgi:hypothetical protein
MKLFTTVLDRLKIAEFINTIEGRRAFENAQRDILTLSPIVSYLENDVSNSSNIFFNTELKVEVEKGNVYMVDAALTFQSASLNNGIGVAFELPSGVSISFNWRHNHTAKDLEGGYNIASGSVSGDTNAVPAINQNIPLTGHGLIKADSSGTVVLQFRSESASTVTLKGGLCVLRLMQVV